MRLTGYWDYSWKKWAMGVAIDTHGGIGRANRVIHAKVRLGPLLFGAAFLWWRMGT